MSATKSNFLQTQISKPHTSRIVIYTLLVVAIVAVESYVDIGVA